MAAIFNAKIGKHEMPYRYWDSDAPAEPKPANPDQPHEMIGILVEIETKKKLFAERAADLRRQRPTPNSPHPIPDTLSPTPDTP